MLKRELIEQMQGLVALYSRCISEAQVLSPRMRGLNVNLGKCDYMWVQQVNFDPTTVKECWFTGNLLVNTGCLTLVNSVLENYGHKQALRGCFG